MKSTSQESNKTQKIQHKGFVLYIIMFIIISVTVGMPIFHWIVIYPRFVQELVGDTEEKALFVGHHMSRKVLETYSNGRFIVSDQLSEYIELMSRDFNLWKVKIYESSGRILYSTVKEEIGNINENEYFHTIVAKGVPYSNVVEKETLSLEGQIVDSDLIEIYVPILQNGEFLGAFELYYDITNQRDSLESLIKQYTIMILIMMGLILMTLIFTLFFFLRSLSKEDQYKKVLFHQANTDPLTGLHNRRSFEYLLRWELEKAKRYQLESTILMFDIDHFKKVNDKYGHQTGDRILQELAHVCKKTFRKSDITCRYGGEEFIVMLPETIRDDAFFIAEKLRKTIEQAYFELESHTIRVTISIGISRFGSTVHASVEDIIKIADEAMYRAKESGRNRTVC